MARSASTEGRKIGTYLDGYYDRQWRENGRLEVPDAPHILLSACESIQQAGDLPVGALALTKKKLYSARPNIQVNRK